jgi:hypothetical protein
VSCGECMLAGFHCVRPKRQEEQPPQAQILRVLGQGQQGSHHAGAEVPLALRPGRAARRDRLEGPLGGPDPSREPHGGAKAGARRPMAAAGAEGPPGEPPPGPPSDAS